MYFATRLSLLTVCAALGLALPACADQIAVGRPFPDLASANLEGDVPTGLKGKVVIVDFFASWCGPCRQAMPFLSTLQEEHADDGLVIIGVSCDTEAKDMKSFLERVSVSFPTVRDAQQKLVSACDIQGMPTSFVLDREGKVRFIHTGFHKERSEAEFRAQVKELLK